MADNQDFEHKATAKEGAIELLTYAIKGENCNPVFRSQYGVAHIYPYTLLDDIESKPVVKEYHTLILENRYLRVTVIPDLGGRVYSVYDKISQREVFYKNQVVKFSPLAIRGAFFSGGVEFSFPVAHAPTTADPVNWELHQNADGSASISFGGLEHISRLRWVITLTLFPDLCALAQDVQLYNPYSLPGRYHYWTNASLDADDQTEFIYPLRRVRSYEFAGTTSWPSARLDLIQQDPGLPGMEGVPMWPANRMQTPVNFRWQKNMLAQVSIFGRDVRWDFFGAWRHSVNHGYAHYANHRDVAGMKLWSWGNAPVGVVNQTALTDDGSVYAETQCGAMETQLDFDFLQPDATRAWREWWLPLREIGGITCASAQVGASLKLAVSLTTDLIDFTLGVCPARSFQNINLQVSAAEKILFTQQIDLSPEKPGVYKFSARRDEVGAKPLRLCIFDQQGNPILNHILDREPSPVLPFVANIENEPKTSQDFYLLGLKHENYDNREQALNAYRKAIELAPDNGEAHLRLGLMMLRAADFPQAQVHFEAASKAKILDANYYLGQIASYDRQTKVARQYYQAVPEGHGFYKISQICLGNLYLQERNGQAAQDVYACISAQDDHAIMALLLSGIAQRLLGKNQKARTIFLSVLARDPLNHPALCELVGLDTNNEDKDKLTRWLADDRQYILDLACFYMSVGLLEDALKVLNDFAQDWQYPMVGYLAAYLCRVMQREKDALRWLEIAGNLKPDYVFPSRIEEAVALAAVLKENPQDHKAKYYLGNFMYGRQRYEEGVRLWRDALEGLSNFDVLYRNLGLSAWQRDKDFEQAIELFEKAVTLNPDNQDVYIHLDDLYKAQGLTSKRQQILEKIFALSAAREDVHKRAILILVDLGRYEDALKMMGAEKFVPLEMDQSFHDLFVRALLQHAESLLSAGRVEDAIPVYRRALEFPANLGVGAPTTSAQAHIYYRLGLAYERAGQYQEALSAWQHAAGEHHSHDNELYPYVQMALDKLNRYSELGFE